MDITDKTKKGNNLNKYLTERFFFKLNGNKIAHTHTHTPTHTHTHTHTHQQPGQKPKKGVGGRE